MNSAEHQAEQWSNVTCRACRQLSPPASTTAFNDTCDVSDQDLSDLEPREYEHRSTPAGGEG